MSTELITIIRPSFMKFCQDGCKAAAFNHMLYWIAKKAKNEPQEKIKAGQVMWYATTEDITEGLSNAWGVCKVRKEVNNIIDMGIIGRGSNPTWGADRTKHFYFGPEQCATLLTLFQKYTICLYCLGLPSEVIHLIDLSNANDKNIICKCVKHQMEMINLSDGNDKSIEAITKVSTKVSTKVTNKEERTTAPAAPLVQSSSLSLLEKMTEEERAFWEMWAKRFPSTPKVTEKAFEAVGTLAPHIKTEEELTLLFDYSLKRLEAWKGVGNVGAINLTNLANYLNDWSQQKPIVAPAAPQKPEKKIPAPEEVVFWYRTFCEEIREQNPRQLYWLFDWIPYGEIDEEGQNDYIENSLSPLDIQKVEWIQKLHREGLPLPAGIKPPPYAVAI